MAASLSSSFEPTQDILADLVFKNMKESLADKCNLWTAIYKLWTDMDACNIAHTSKIKDSVFIMEFKHDMDEEWSIFVESLIHRIFANLSRLDVETFHNGNAVGCRCQLK